MNIITKKTIIKTQVWRVVLCYENETRSLNKNENSVLEALKMWCWIMMLRISCIERRTNEAVLETIQEKRTLIDTLKRRKC